MANTIFKCMLVGAAGAGKSSFINTLIGYVNTTEELSQEKLKSYIPTAKSQTMGGHTMTREPVQLTHDLIVVDNRGWHDWNNKAALKELAAQIHGDRSIDDDVIWDDDSNSSTEDDSNVTLLDTDKVDCTTLVLNGVGGIDAVENITKLIETCRKRTKRPPSVVITHKDEISHEETESMIVFLENEQINREKIFVLKNVTSKDDILDDETRLSICDFIASCRVDGEAGAQAHIRRENLMQKVEKSKAAALEKKILDSKNELRELEISESKARTEGATEHAKEMALMKEMHLKREMEHNQKLQEMSEKKQIESYEREKRSQELSEKSLKEISELTKKNLIESQERDKRSQDLTEKNLKEMRELKKKNLADSHEHEKKVYEQFTQDLLKKIEETL